MYVPLDCDTGWYGEDCKETCRQCRDPDQCSHINGTCLTGCRAGFQGDFCNISKYNSYVCIKNQK